MTDAATTAGPSVELVSHASLLVQAEGMGLLSDPWLQGTVFGGSWRLLRTPDLADDLWERVNRLWISHSHPDHYHVASLLSIPERTRARLPVLLTARQGSDTLARGLRELGFGQVEHLPAGGWHRLGEGVELFSAPFDLADRDDQGDSFLFVRAGGTVILNLNDCVVRHPWQAREILRRAELNRVDLLCTQFSYGQWAGNPEDVEERAAKAQRKLDRMAMQANAFRADAVLPFASFYAFSHQENAYLNDEVVTPRQVTQRLNDATGTRPLVLYPGERWRLGDPWDSTRSAERWQRHYDAAREPLSAPSPAGARSAPQEQVLAAARRWNQNLAATTGAPLLGLLRATGLLPGIGIQLTDHRTALRLVPGHDVRLTPHTSRVDVRMTSQAALRCFASPFGPEEIRFGGRLRSGTGDVARFMRLATTTGLLASRPSGLISSEIRRLIARWTARSRDLPARRASRHRDRVN